MKKNKLNPVDNTSILTKCGHIDIAVIMESWLHSGIDMDLTNLPGYTCYRRDRSDGRNGGGVVLLVENSIPCTEHIRYAAPTP